MQKCALWFATALATAGILLISGCGRKGSTANMTATTTTPVTVEGLRALSGKKIFFGHQSVGYNIIAGAGDVLKRHPEVRLNIVESADPGVFSGPVLAHAAVGRNSEPESKIREFAERMRGGLGDRVDIATFKFCYIDFNKDSDAARLFGIYNATMADLVKAYPKTRFVHVTVPLKATARGWKANIKNLLGRPDPWILDNLRRDEFNELMRKEYAGRQPFFDLAAVEATRADGAISCDKSDGKMVPSLVNEYTFDSGHLNERGRKFVAERFLATLSSL
jgi:hypothetical protein